MGPGNGSVVGGRWRAARRRGRSRRLAPGPRTAAGGVIDRARIGERARWAERRHRWAAVTFRAEPWWARPAHRGGRRRPPQWWAGSGAAARSDDSAPGHAGGGTTIRVAGAGVPERPGGGCAGGERGVGRGVSGFGPARIGAHGRGGIGWVYPLAIGEGIMVNWWVAESLPNRFASTQRSGGIGGMGCRRVRSRGDGRHVTDPGAGAARVIRAAGGAGAGVRDAVGWWCAVTAGGRGGAGSVRGDLACAAGGVAWLQLEEYRYGYPARTDRELGSV